LPSAAQNTEGRNMAQFPYQYYFLTCREALPESFATTRALANGWVDLPRLEAGQHPGRDWNWDSRRGSSRDAIKCGQAIAAASIASWLLSPHHAWHTSRGSCRSCCLAYHPSSSLGLGAGPPPSAATRPIHLPRL